MENIAYAIAMITMVACFSLSARINKIERIIKKAGLTIEKKSSLYHVLDQNIGKTGKLIYHSGASLFGKQNITCFIMDVDEEWILIEETKKKEQMLLHLDSVVSVQF